jgi:hypothetical protein
LNLILYVSSSIPTQEEREAEELAKIKPFKARPVNSSVLYSAGDMGVPKVEKPQLTQPVVSICTVLNVFVINLAKGSGLIYRLE